MWIIGVALNRPYTFIVLALLILILSPVVILRTPTDVFPSINILDNIGLPSSNINYIYNRSGLTDAADVDILVSLKEKRHRTAGYGRTLRGKHPSTP
jgi:hypothetical protein